MHSISCGYSTAVFFINFIHISAHSQKACGTMKQCLQYASGGQDNFVVAQINFNPRAFIYLKETVVSSDNDK